MVALARSAALAGSGFPVYGVHEGPWAPAAASRYLRGSFFWQSALSDTERICAGLLQLARQIGRLPVLIPTDDAGAIFPLEHGSGLLEAFLVSGPPGTPVVVSTEHSIGETHLERRRITRGVRYLYLATERLSDGTVAVSETVRDRLVAWGVPGDRITLIPNGVDLGRVAFDPAAWRGVRAEFGVGPHEYVIGVMGWFDPQKQFDLVIEAAAPLLGGRVKLLAVGKGDERGHLEEVARACGVTDQVIFTGERHDVAAMLSAFDVFVASSAQETFGLSVLEVLANGAPVLYTTCPALRGLDADQARHVPATVSGLREALAAEVEAGPRECQSAPAVEREYGIKAVTARIDDLYERLSTTTVRRRFGSARSAAQAAHIGVGAGEPVLGTAGRQR